MFPLNYIGLTILLSFIFSQGEVKKPTPPNILFFLVDDLGWTDMGCYGSKYYDTPNLDEFSQKAVRFTNAYSASPVCSPTRAAIMTGKHPVRINITDWIPGMSFEKVKDPKLRPPEDIHNMPLSEFTLAEALEEKGYRTFFAGKWHLGETSDHWPEHQGFDINKGGHDRGSPRGGYYSPYKNPRLGDGPEGEYLTDRLTDESIAFLESVIDDPFFLYLSFYTVHTPIQGCYKYDDLYMEKKQKLPNQGNSRIRREHRGETRLNQSNPKYAAMVRSMDEDVGRVLNRLKELDLIENTIIVFTSDNGGLSTTRRKGGPTSVLPLRAGKGWCYEGGIRVPAMIHYPGMKTGGKVCNSPVISMDFYPTILELAGIPFKPNQHMDGTSIAPLLKNPKKVEERTMVWHYPHYHGSTWTPGSAIRYGKWKLIEFYEEDKIELYDLSNDIGEQNDLAYKMPEKAENLRKKMHAYIDERVGKYPIRIDN